MKKTIRMMALAMAILMMGVLLMSCSKTLSGTYSNGVDIAVAGGQIAYTFNGSKVNIKVTTKVLGISSEKSYEGTYAIEKATNESGDTTDAETITFTFTEKDASTYSGSFSFKQDDTSITIGGIQYIKQK